MEMRDLHVFIVLAEELHFGRSAERLHASTTQVSKRIKRLEAELGGPLLYRSTREVRLTELGEKLLAGAVPHYHTHESLKQRIQERAVGRIGTVRLAVNVSATYSVLPTMLRILSERRPGVNIGVVNAQGYTSYLEEALLQARVDLIVARGPLKSPELASFSLFREPMTVIMPVNHQLAEREVVDLIELNGESLVSFPLHSGSAVATWVDHVLRKEGIQMHRYAEAEESMALLGLVAAGLGVAIVPQSVSVLQPNLPCARLKGLPVSETVLGWHHETRDALTLSVVSLMKKDKSALRPRHLPQ